MKNEMIERVARAIDPYFWMMQDQLKENAPEYWAMENPNNEREQSLNIARAAIQAMYEPTDQQRNFYYKLKRESGSTPMYSTFEDATWQMMILACLEQVAIDEQKMD